MNIMRDGQKGVEGERGRERGRGKDTERKRKRHSVGWYHKLYERWCERGKAKCTPLH